MIKKALAHGVPPYEIFTKGMVKGITVVGQKYESGEYFLTELVGAGEVVKEGMEEIGPYLSHSEVKPLGTVVIGTVEGDLHDIGKNIVKMLLTSTGFAVKDLGVDVSAGKFVEAVKETEPDIVAMSALLTTTMNSMRTTVEELQKAGLRRKVKVIVGGAPITEEFGKEIGAITAVGEKYERGEYFLTELVGAGEVVKDGMEEISPHLKQGEVKPVGSVVIGTVEGDLHDIGKNIVKMLLTSVGFTVHDLGVDVAPGKFVEVVRENKPDIVAMSALLTTTMDSMRTTVKELQKAGLRQTVKIIVGGAPINEEFGKEIGADSAAMDAAQGVRICKAWVEDDLNEYDDG